MDLIRSILLRVENNTGDEPLTEISVEGKSQEEIAYNVYLLHEAQLISGYFDFVNDMTKPKKFRIYRMTWAGHEFLDACRDEGRWVKAKEIFRQAGGVSFDVAKQILIQLMIQGATTFLTTHP